MEVVAVAARRDMVEALIAAMRDAGLRPVGIDLSAFGMIRALARRRHGANGAEPAAPATRSGRARARSRSPPGSGTLYCNLGDVTNLAVARGIDLPLHPHLAVRRRGRSPSASPSAAA